MTTKNSRPLTEPILIVGAPGEYAPIMSHYFESVADERWKVTDTVGQVLGRKPRSYAQWLDRNLPDILTRAA